MHFYSTVFLTINVSLLFYFSSIVWGLFHVPVMILLTNRLKPSRPYITVIVQSVSCLLSAFPHGWLAVKSGYVNGDEIA
jgi:MFS-type transporter involved in bile tolerance (Atg22 family)